MTDTDKRKQYISSMKAKLDDLDQQIDKLEHRGEEVETSIKQEFNEQLDELRQRRAQASDKLNEIRNASEQEWQKLQDQLEHTWDAAKHSFNYFLSHFK